VYAWGFNGQGEIGDGSTKTATKPVLVYSGASMVSSTAGNVAIADAGFTQRVTAGAGGR
jgi:hypothetical protein